MPAQPTPPRISGYDFIQPLGTGATASVYRYHQRVPSRDVAIKVSSATSTPAQPPDSAMRRTTWRSFPRTPTSFPSTTPA